MLSPPSNRLDREVNDSNQAYAVPQIHPVHDLHVPAIIVIVIITITERYYLTSGWAETRLARSAVALRLGDS